MFINLSNHPSAIWSTEQLEAAREFGIVRDLSFPVVSPHMSEEEVSALADVFVERVMDISPEPCIVHVMGEQTFSYAIIGRLLSRCYTCVASTTERIVEVLPDGSKVSKFCFVRFRKYET